MFSPPNKETACGMFTTPHIISLIICLALVTLAIIFARRLSDKQIKTMTRIFAIVFAVLEVIKIIYKFIIGEGKWIDHWFPLFFCSLFIYALFMCGYGKGAIYRLGSSFMMTGCIIGGLAFLIVPATSLMDHPIYHFLSLHSMLFHSSMVFVGVTYLLRGHSELTLKNYASYAIFTGAPIAIALILNPILDSNLMILSKPVNMPIDFINQAYDFAPIIYQAGVTIVYIALPYFLILGIVRLIYKIKSKKKNSTTESEVSV